MSLKILHTADVHIGKNYSNLSSDEQAREDLVNQRYDVMNRLISEANEEECDLVVIAGDLFDTPRFRKKKDVEEIRPHLEKFEGRAVLILPGNHDYYSERNSDNWGWLEDIDNVLVLKEEKPYDISDRMEEGNETIIYPAPCDEKISKENNLGWIKETEMEDGVKYHIGVAHGHLEGCSYDEEEKYFQMTKDELEGCDLDLWLLGHVHVMLPRQSSSVEDYFYPGTPEQDDFARLGEGSEKGKAWIIELDDGKGISAEDVDVGKYTLSHEDITVEDTDTFEELKEYVEDGSHEDELVKLTIQGKMDKDGYEEARGYINGLREDSKGFKYIEVDDGDFTRRIDMDVVEDEFPEGSFSHSLLKEVLEDGHELSGTAAELAYEIIEEGR